MSGFQSGLITMGSGLFQEQRSAAHYVVPRATILAEAILADDAGAYRAHLDLQFHGNQ